MKIVEQDGKTLWIFPYGSLEWCVDVDKSNTAILGFLWVEDNYRRQGMGHHMMKKWCQHLATKRIWNIELDNVLEKKNHFYQKLGFRYKEQGDNTMYGKTITILQH